MIFLDTTILIYAVGGEHALRGPCEQVFEAVAAGRVAATTSVGVIQEFAYTRARRMGRRDAAVHAARYAELLAPLVAMRQEHVAPALELYESHEELDASDAFLAAGALDAGARALVSADRAFAVVPGLRYVDPATPELSAVIRA